MKPVLVYSAFILLVFSTIFLIFSISHPPVIYAPEEHVASSVFHTNINAERSLIINSSSDMLPIIQDLLDYSGPIALNLRMKDLESARNDLDAYSRKYRKLNNLVINLEMNESEIQDFSNNTRLQDDLYRELMNSSYSLDELKRLEFRYRDKQDSIGLKTVAYQGQALKKKIQSVKERYNIVSQDLIRQSEIYNLDTSGIKKSQQEITRYADEVAASELKEIDTSIQPDQSPPKKISLVITPDHGIIRDPIMFSGFASGGSYENSLVSIFIDNKSFFKISSDENGQFRRTVTIGQIPAGIHQVFALWDSIRSDEINFTVIPINSSLTLNISTELFRPEIRATGYLEAKNLLFRNATVNLVVNNETRNVTRTGRNGFFVQNLTLPAGKHYVYALFYDRSFPLNSSRSLTWEVSSTGTFITSVRLVDVPEEPPYGLLAGILVLVLLIISIPYLVKFLQNEREKFSKSIPSPDTKHGNEVRIKENGLEVRESSLGEEITSETGKMLLTQYHDLLNETGLSSAARSIYIGFIFRIMKKEQIHLPLTLTPHEVIEKILKKPYVLIFSAFVLHYEKIRYGGAKGETEEQSFESILSETDEALGECTHEE